MFTAMPVYEMTVMAVLRNKAKINSEGSPPRFYGRIANASQHIIMEIA
jgi:hypothetical protein